MGNNAWIDLEADVERVEFFTVLGEVLKHTFPDGAVVLGPHPDPLTFPRDQPLGVTLMVSGRARLPLVQFWWDGPNRISCDHRHGTVGYWVAYRVLQGLQGAFMGFDDAEPPRCYDEGVEGPLPYDPTPKSFLQYALHGLEWTPQHEEDLRVLNKPYYESSLGPYLTRP